MSLEDVTNEIRQYISDDEPDALVIKGKWGVGKTFLWAKLLIQSNQSGTIARPKYAYVSLFGIDNIEQLKHSIFENTISSEFIDSGVSLTTFIKQIGELSTPGATTTSLSTISSFISRKLGRAKTLPLIKDFAPFIDSASSLLINNMLICLDDIERKSEKLNAEELFGFISILKEQKKCKLVLILNESEFDEKFSDAYTKYREKVIDKEISYQPSTPEVLSLIQESGLNVDERLTDYMNRLNINNIRIILKVNRHWKDICQYIKGFREETITKISHSLVLLAWCYYSGDEGAPSLDYVRKTNQISIIFDEEKELEDDEAKELEDSETTWNRILRAYEYEFSDDIDNILADYLESGFINSEGFLKQCKNIDAMFEKGHGENEITKAWRVFHDSFDDNDEEFVHEVIEKVKENMEYIGLDHLDSAAWVLRELGRGNEADSLIELFIKLHKDDTSIFDSGSSFMTFPPKDPVIKRRFAEVYAQNVTKPSVPEVLRRISENPNWSTKDEEAIADYSADEFYKLFKATKGPELDSIIQVCLDFGKFSNASDQQKRIADNAKDALLRIRGESKINELRIRKFRLKLPNTEAKE